MWKKFYNLLKGYKITYIILYLTKTSYMLLKMLMPLVLACIVDEVLYHHNLNVMGSLILLYIVIFVAFLILSASDVVIWQFLSNYLVVSIKNTLWKKILNLKMVDYGEYEYAEIVNIINEDSRAFVRLINQNLLPFVNAVTTALITIIILFIIDIYVGLFTLIVLPIIVLINKKWLKKARNLSTDARKKKIESTSFLVDVISHFRDVKLLGTENFFQDKLYRSLHDYHQLNKSIELGAEIVKVKVNTINTFSKICIWILVALATFKGDVTLGNYIAISQYLSYAYDAFQSVFNFNFQITQRRINLTKIFGLLDKKEEELDIGEELVITNGTIKFDNIEFGYSEQTILKHLSFTLEKNKINGLIGKNGCGKSTIVSLLNRLYKLDKGHIFIDGQDINNVSLRSLRNNICVVMQLEKATRIRVIDYIKSYNNVLNDDEIIEKLRQYEFCAFLFEGEKSPGKFMNELSGGQRQCVQIAAALMNNAPILILDEPTSMVDNNLEKTIFSTLSGLKRNRTILLIAHGEKYRKHYDAVIDVEQFNCTC